MGCSFGSRFPADLTDVPGCWFICAFLAWHYTREVGLVAALADPFPSLLTVRTKSEFWWIALSAKRTVSLSITWCLINASLTSWRIVILRTIWAEFGSNSLARWRWQCWSTCWTAFIGGRIFNSAHFTGYFVSSRSGSAWYWRVRINWARVRRCRWLRCIRRHSSRARSWWDWTHWFHWYTAIRIADNCSRNSGRRFIHLFRSSHSIA